MVSLLCNINIYCKDSQKKIIIDKVMEISVTTSIHNLTDTATISLPKKFKDKNENDIQAYLNPGDKITIETKYAEFKDWNLIFEGYITRISDTTPIVITCENNMYLLKRITVKPELIEKFDIKEWFKSYIEDIEIETTGEMIFGSLDIDSEMTMAQALDGVMKVYGFVKCYFHKNKLYVTMLTSPFANKKPISLDIRRNVISDNLEYIKADDVKISIKATSILPDNTKLEVIVPKEAESDKKEYEQRHFYAPECKTKEELTQYANEALKKFKIDKVTGQLTLFGVPFVEKTDIVCYYSDNKEISQRCYFVDSVSYKFGLQGYRQTVSLGNRLEQYG